MTHHYPNIVYTQRPANYWDDTDILTAILTDVKGRRERKEIQAHWDRGQRRELVEALDRDHLSLDTRIKLGRIDGSPTYDDGMPEREPGEVEIAYIEAESISRQQISIRAKPDPEGVRYRIVNEFGTEFEQPFKTSADPLTLQKLIEFIDQSAVCEMEYGVATYWNNQFCENSRREDYRYCTLVGSTYYPQLWAHYEKVFDDWIGIVSCGACEPPDRRPTDSVP